MLLHELAHARAGDKGDTADITVIAHHPEDYEHLRTHVTGQRVREHFADTVRGGVERHEIPQLRALKFVLHEALDGGVTRSPRLDPHGKSFSSRLLALEVPAPAERFTRSGLRSGERSDAAAGEPPRPARHE